jgi:ubiquinone biosynthesis protein
MIHIKDVFRLREIVAVFFEEGFGYYINKSKLGSHLPFRKKLIPTKPLSDKEHQAIRLRRAFEKLGPTFVKFGQLLSLRSDLVPQEYCKEFEKLQDRVPSFSYNQAKKIIESDLKKPIHKLFRKFDVKPIASASMSQVHRATLYSGKKVAVKVQRPNIRKIIDADLDILFHIAYSLEKHFKKIRNYRPVDIVKEFALWTRKELNFELEARRAKQLKDEMKNNKNVSVPKVYFSYTSKRILTLEFVDGVKIDNLPVLKKYNINLKKLSITYFTSILEQALIHGLFHADPHPANIFVNKKGKLIYLDYGIMGELSAGDRKKIINFILSIPDKDADKSLNIIISLARDISGSDIDVFKEETIEILKEVYNNSIEKKSYARALYEIIGLGAKYGVIFDPNHVLMAKATYQAEGIGLKLNPKFKVADGLEKFASSCLQDEYSPLNILRKVKRTIWTNKELILDLPEHIIKIIKKLEHIEPVQQSNIQQPIRNIESQKNYIHNSSIRILGIMTSTLIIASTIFFYLEGRTTIFHIPLSIILFVLAIILLTYFIFLNRKKEEEDGRNN